MNNKEIAERQWNRILERDADLRCRPSLLGILRDVLNELQPEPEWLNAPDSDGWWEFHTATSHGACCISIERTKHFTSARGLYAGTTGWQKIHTGGKWRRLHLSPPEPTLPEVPTRFIADFKGRPVAGVFVPDRDRSLQCSIIGKGVIGQTLSVDELTNIQFLDAKTGKTCELPEE